MDPESYPITPKRGSHGRTSGTYYINSRRNFYRPRDELVDINFYNENIASDDEKSHSRKFCCCICILVTLLVLLSVAAFVIFLGIFPPSSPIGSHCLNASNEAIIEFDKFAEKYQKTYNNESEVCSRLEAFAINSAKYENGSIKIGSALFGVTTFSDWTETERTLPDEVNLQQYGDGIVAPLGISKMNSPPAKSWNHNGLAKDIHFDDSKSVEENMVHALFQWHNFSSESILKLSDNMTLSVTKLAGENLTYFQMKLYYFDTWGAFASNIVVPSEIHDYQEGVISECEEVLVVPGIICGYGQLNGSYYWEVQPIGSSWQSWGVNGTVLISDDDCSMEQLSHTEPNIYSIKNTA